MLEVVCTPRFEEVFDRIADAVLQAVDVRPAALLIRVLRLAKALSIVFRSGE